MKIASFSLMIALAVAIMSIFQFERYQNLKTITENTLQQLQTEHKTMATHLTEELNKLNTKMLTETVTPQNTQKENSWMLAKIDYLVRQAALTLQLTRDVKTAEILLHAALEHLQTLKDPKLLPLQESLLHELHALEAVTLPNLEELWLKISLLIEEVPTLTLTSPQIAEPTTSVENPAPETVNASAWQAALKKSLTAMKDIVKIRKHSKPIDPLLSEPEILYEKQRLSLMLEEIRFAILMPKPLIYQHIIKETLAFLARFEKKEEKIIKMQETLSELSAINLHPELPNLVHTLEQLQLLQE
jgi:uroporphyrin-3 C-methyltransferase